MPELPEIETVKLQLQKALTGKKIVDVEVLKPQAVIGNPQLIIGKKIASVNRRAKVLLIDLEGDIDIAFHFKMTGQLIFDADGKSDTLKDRIVGGHPTEDFVGKLPSSHTRVVIKLEHGTLFFNDQRMFGWMRVDTKENIAALPFLQSLGPEPFDITDAEFIARVSKSKRPIKLVLMDQTVISGVGNIYANDALWEAQIHPNAPANTISTNKISNLFKGLIKVLSEGIKYGGATAADAKYIDLHGLGGHYQDHFRTYDRTGKKCLREDGGTIKKYVLGGRGTYYCPKCQIL